MTTWKPTAVQQDVIDRLKDGWEIHGYGPPWLIRKKGEAPRHVRLETLEGLERRGFVRWNAGHWGWGLIDGADA